jgi:hypothetical protein
VSGENRVFLRYAHHDARARDGFEKVSIGVISAVSVASRWVSFSDQVVAPSTVDAGEVSSVEGQVMQDGWHWMISKECFDEWSRAHARCASA